jgi:hypothetical protein
LKSYSIPTSNITIISVPADYGAFLLSDARSGACHDDAFEEEYLKKLYQDIISLSPTHIVINSVTLLTQTFPTCALPFLKYLHAYTLSTKGAPEGTNSTTLLTSVDCSAILNSITSQSSSSTSLSSVSAVSGSVDCKYIGLGGKLGLSNDERNSGLNSYLYDLHSPIPLQGSLPSGSLPSSTASTASTAFLVRTADIVYDVTTLPSGYTKNALGSITWFSEKYVNGKRINFNYQDGRVVGVVVN